MRIFRNAILTALAILLCVLFLTASIPNVPTGTWQTWNAMTDVRSGAAAVLFSDGRVLIAGGANANGPSASADLFGTDGVFSATAAMNSPRSNHTATLLGDGRVLVTGGETSSGATNSAEVYDPAAGSWTLLGAAMLDARAGHTASLLPDGRVLLAGGHNSGGALSSLEIFDPLNDGFSSAGTLTAPRMKHSAAVLGDGRVLVIGGTSDGANPLATVDIYDPINRTVGVGPNLSTPRMSATATTTLDGRVAVIGGSNGSEDLASAEVFDPATGQITVSASNLATARSGHSAFLLPNNNSILIVGGTSGGTDLNSAELYAPWTDSFQATGTMSVARPGMTGSALSLDGRFLAAGGTSLASTELYGFATVKTDAADYPPGSTVTITGSGWQPGESVTLTLVESPLIDTHPPMTAVADGNGNIVNNQFSPDEHDVDVRFYLTAVGSQSGLQAQYTFTDASLTGALITVKDSSCSSNQNVFTVGATVCASIAVTTSGGGAAPDLFIEWFNPSNTLVQTTTKSGVANNSTQTDTLALAGANAVAGTWTVQSCKNTGCSGGNLVDTRTFTVSPGPVSAATSTVSANSTSVTADGSTTSTITVTLKDASNNPVSGKSVSLTAGSGSSTITTVSGTTNASGQATFTVKDATVESVTYSTKDTTDNLTIIQTATVNFVAGPANAAKSTVSASPTSVTADGSTTSTITVTLIDADNHPVNGKTVTLTAGAGSSTISAASGVSNASGVVTFTVKDTAVESVTYTAKDTTDNVTVTQTATVNFIAGAVSAAASTVSASPASVAADGSTTSTITVTLKDANNHPVSGKTVTLTAGSGSSTISAASGPSNASGVVTFTVKDTAVESVTYTANDTSDTTTISQTATVNFTAGPANAAKSTLSASPTSVAADGSTTSTITVTLIDANNHPVSGKTVTLSQGTGSSTISAASGTSNGSGVVTFTVKDTKAETVTYTATDTTDSVTITQTAAVTFSAGAVTAGTSTVTASPTAVTADGATTSTITVTLKDANNNPVSGKAVSLAQGTGSSTISAASGPSSVAGVVTFTVKDTKAETVSYTATDSTDSITITQTAAVTFAAGALHHFTIDAISSPQTAGTAFNIAVTAKDVNNNTVTAFDGNGFKVMLTSTGTLVGAPITTPSFTNGVLVQTVTITNTGSFTITATGIGGNSGISGTSNSFTVNPGSVNAGTSTVVANPTSVVANGTSTSTITVTLKDALSNPVSSKTVSLTAGSGSSTVSTISGTTNASGQASFTVKDSVIESVTYTAKDTADNVTVTQTATVSFTVGPVNAGTSTVIATPTSVIADGTSISTITVTLKDASSRPVSGKAVSLTAGSGSSSINTISGTTNASGQATFTVKDTVPENVTYSGNDTTDTITVTQTATVNFISPATTTQVTSSLSPSTFGVSVMFTATVTSLSGTPEGSVAFYDGSCGGTLLAGPTTLDMNGKATFSISTLAAGSHTVFACYTPTGFYLGSSGSVIQLVNQATPGITWADPADITYGAPLSGTQLNATASVPGAFVYAPPAGTILNAGNGQTLSAVFTPADPIDFATVTPSVHINVLKADPIIVWKNPADITYPTALSSTQLNAIALPPASSLTGWWKGDGDANDAVAGNNGTAQGGAIFTTGEVNQAFSFPDASGDGFTVLYNSGYDLNAPGFTAAFWMQGSQNANGMETVLEKSYPLDGSTGWAFQVDSASGQLQFDIGGSSPTHALSTANVLDGNFHYIVGTWDGGNTMSLYVDGISQGPVTLAAAPVNNSGGLNIGFSSSGTPQYFQGAVDEVQIFGKPLPAGAYIYSPASGMVLMAGMDQTLSVMFNPTDTANLNSANKDVTINVTKANQVITFSALGDKIYGDVPFTVSANGGGSSNPVTFMASPMTVCTSSGTHGSTITIAGTGLCTVTADQAGDANYNPASSVPESFTVNPKPITANLTAADKTYDGTNTEPDANMSCSLTGVLAGDSGNVSCAATSGTFNTSQVVSANLVTATVTISGSAAGNYTLGTVGTSVSSTSATVTAHITTKAITATLTAADKTYDGTTTEPNTNMSCSVNGVMAADSGDVSCVPTSGTFDSKDVATASQVTATVTISGTAAGNYTLGAAGTTTLSTSTMAPAHITTKAITATLTAADKTYDGNTAEPDASMNCSLTGVLAGDSANVNCTASSGSFNTSQVLTANQVTATVTISGTGAGNYTLGTAGTTTSSASAMATAHITTKAITATLTAADKIYDGTTTETNAMSCSLTGVLGADSASVSCAASSGTFNTSQVVTATQVTATAMISGTAASNYTLGAVGTTTPSNSATATAHITTRPITVTPLVGQSKVYGTMPDPALTYSVGGSGLATGDMMASVFTGALARAGAENVGNYLINQGSLLANSNYNLTFVPGVTFAITRAPLTITPDGGKTKTLGSVFSAFTGVVNGLQFSDAVTVTYTSAGAPAAAGVASYDITVASYSFTTGIASNYMITTNTAVKGLAVLYAAGGMCAGDVGHTIRQPINVDGSSVWKQNATVPAKFAVCDVNGVSIGTPGVVSNFLLLQTINGTVTTTVNELPDSTTPDTAFRWDPTGQQWIYNINTKAAPVNKAGQTYVFTIMLNDGSTIGFRFGLR